MRRPLDFILSEVGAWGGYEPGRSRTSLAAVLRTRETREEASVVFQMQDDGAWAEEAAAQAGRSGQTRELFRRETGLAWGLAGCGGGVEGHEEEKRRQPGLREGEGASGDIRNQVPGSHPIHLSRRIRRIFLRRGSICLVRASPRSDFVTKAGMQGHPSEVGGGRRQERGCSREASRAQSCWGPPAAGSGPPAPRLPVCQ